MDHIFIVKTNNHNIISFKHEELANKFRINEELRLKSLYRLFKCRTAIIEEWQIGLGRVLLLEEIKKKEAELNIQLKFNEKDLPYWYRCEALLIERVGFKNEM